jgi:hypothetical protein
VLSMPPRETERMWSDYKVYEPEMKDFLENLPIAYDGNFPY